MVSHPSVDRGTFCLTAPSILSRATLPARTVAGVYWAAMELPDGLKPDLHKLLLGPVSLFSELLGAFVPGIAFVGLMLMKRRWSVTVLLAYPALGYRTKIAIGLFTAYLIGKVSFILTPFFVELFSKKPEKLEDGPGAIFQKFMSEIDPAMNSFINGLFAGPLIFSKQMQSELLGVYGADLSFKFSLGSLLCLASAVPGNGQFRFVELAVGLLLLTLGAVGARKSLTVLGGVLGMSVGELLSKLTLEDLPKYLPIASAVITHLSPTKTPITKEQNPVPPEKPSLADTLREPEQSTSAQNDKILEQSAAALK